MTHAAASKADFRFLVHTTAKMLAGRHYERTAPPRITASDYVAARWPEFVSMAVDFLALQAARQEAAAAVK